MKDITHIRSVSDDALSTRAIVIQVWQVHYEDWLATWNSMDKLKIQYDQNC